MKITRFFLFLPLALVVPTLVFAGDGEMTDFMDAMQNNGFLRYHPETNQPAIDLNRDQRISKDEIIPDLNGDGIIDSTEFNDFFVNNVESIFLLEYYKAVIEITENLYAVKQDRLLSNNRLREVFISQIDVRINELDEKQSEERIMLLKRADLLESSLENNDDTGSIQRTLDQVYTRLSQLGIHPLVSEDILVRPDIYYLPDGTRIDRYARGSIFFFRNPYTINIQDSRGNVIYSKQIELPGEGTRYVKRLQSTFADRRPLDIETPWGFVASLKKEDGHSIGYYPDGSYHYLRFAPIQLEDPFSEYNITGEFRRMDFHPTGSIRRILSTQTMPSSGLSLQLGNEPISATMEILFRPNFSIRSTLFAPWQEIKLLPGQFFQTDPYNNTIFDSNNRILSMSVGRRGQPLVLPEPIDREIPLYRLFGISSNASQRASSYVSIYTDMENRVRFFSTCDKSPAESFPIPTGQLIKVLPGTRVYLNREGYVCGFVPAEEISLINSSGHTENYDSSQLLLINDRGEVVLESRARLMIDMHSPERNERAEFRRRLGEVTRHVELRTARTDSTPELLSIPGNQTIPAMPGSRFYVNRENGKTYGFIPAEEIFLKNSDGQELVYDSNQIILVNDAGEVIFTARALVMQPNLPDEKEERLAFINTLESLTDYRLDVPVNHAPTRIKSW